MQNEISYNSYYLDASCFSSLEKLKDTLNLLNILKTYANRMTLNIPKQVYEIIILPPDDKFRELPTHISEWIDDEDEKCTQLVLPKWENELGGAREFMSTHCFTMSEAERVDPRLQALTQNNTYLQIITV
jgi:hypothetical protein